MPFDEKGGRGHKKVHSTYSEGKYARMAAKGQRATIRRFLQEHPFEEPFTIGKIKPLRVNKFHMNNRPLYVEAGRRVDWHWLRIEEQMLFRWRATEEEVGAYHKLYQGKIQYMKGTRPNLLWWQLHEAFDHYQDILVQRRDPRVSFITRTWGIND